MPEPQQLPPRTQSTDGPRLAPGSDGQGGGSSRSRDSVVGRDGRRVATEGRGQLISSGFRGRGKLWLPLEGGETPGGGEKRPSLTRARQGCVWLPCGDAQGSRSRGG